MHVSSTRWPGGRHQDSASLHSQQETSADSSPAAAAPASRVPRLAAGRLAGAMLMLAPADRLWTATSCLVPRANLVRKKNDRSPHPAPHALQAIGGLTNMALWLRIPATAAAVADAAAAPSAVAEPQANGVSSSTGGGSGSDSASPPPSAAAPLAASLASAGDTWEWWNQLRLLCSHSTRLGVLLQLTEDLPPPEDLHRWRGEPLK